MKASCDFWPESCAPFVKQLNLIFYVKKEEKKIQNRKARKKRISRPLALIIFNFCSQAYLLCVFELFSCDLTICIVLWPCNCTATLNELFFQTSAPVCAAAGHLVRAVPLVHR